MAKFFNPSPNYNTLEDYNRTNNPVNLNRIVTFFKVQNKTNNEVPGIQLMLDNKHWIMWHYKSVEQRDQDYERLLTAE